MSNDKTGNSNKAAARAQSASTTNTGIEDALDALLATGRFSELQLSNVMYKPAINKDRVLQGILIDHIQMPPVPGDGRPWSAFVIQATATTSGVDRDGNIVEVKEGAEVLIPSTYELDGALAKFCGYADRVYEVAIRPKPNKRELGGGKTLWEYRVIVANAPMPRTAAFLHDAEKSLAIPQPAEVSQLGEGHTADGTAFSKKTGEIVSRS